MKLTLNRKVFLVVIGLLLMAVFSSSGDEELEKVNSNSSLEKSYPTATYKPTSVPTRIILIPTSTPIPTQEYIAPEPTREIVPELIQPSNVCDPSYPDVCIAPYPPDLDCGQVPYKRFAVIGSDPHGFDRDGDGVGCER